MKVNSLGLDWVGAESRVRKLDIRGETIYLETNIIFKRSIFFQIDRFVLIPIYNVEGSHILRGVFIYILPGVHKFCSFEHFLLSHVGKTIKMWNGLGDDSIFYR